MRAPSIKVLGTIPVDEGGIFQIPWRIFITDWGSLIESKLGRRRLSENRLAQLRTPYRLHKGKDFEWWLFRNKVLEVKNIEAFPREELLVHIKHHVLKTEGRLERMQRANSSLSTSPISIIVSMKLRKMVGGFWSHKAVEQTFWKWHLMKRSIKPFYMQLNKTIWLYLRRFKSQPDGRMFWTRL